MTKKSVLKNKLVLTTAVTAALFGYGRRAYAAVCSGSAPNYTCSTAYSSTLGFTATNSSVTTVSGFGVTTAAGDAIDIVGTGTLSFTDAHPSVITGDYSGLRMTAYGATGSITINSDGTITGTNGFGIQSTNLGNGTQSISTTGDVIGWYGGIASNNDSYAGSMTISVASVTALNGVGINAFNMGLSGNLSISASGDVSGTNFGIYAMNTNTGALSISATRTLSISVGGDVSAGALGIVAYNKGGSDLTLITAAGTTVTGDTVAGIVAVNAYDNTGDLTVITHGDVITSGTGALTVAATGVATGAINITTYAAITGSEYGIGTYNKGTGALTIINKTGATVYGWEGIRVQGPGTAGGTITNEAGATITGNTGITAQYATLAKGGIVNYGTIEGTGGTAIDLYGLTAATPITIGGGQIIGDVVDDTPSNNHSLVTVTGDFTSEGSFDVSNFSVAKGAGFTFGTNDSVNVFDTADIYGTMVSGTGSYVSGALNVHNSGTLSVVTDFMVEGYTTNNGTIAIDTGGELTLEGLLPSTGTLSFGVTSKTSHGVLTNYGNPLDLTSQTVVIDVAKVNTLAAGDEILLIDDTDNSLIGGPGGTPDAVSDNSFQWNFSIVNGTGIDSPTSDQQLYAIVSLQPSANTVNNIHALSTMQDLIVNTTDPQLLDILDNLNGAATSAEFNDILVSLQPAEDGGAVVSTLTFIDNSLNLISERLNNLRVASNDAGTTGVSAGNGYYSSEGGEYGIAGQRVWGQVSGQMARQGMRAKIAGFESSLAAATVGMDTENMLEHAIVGVNFSYGKTHINSLNSTRTDTDIDSYQFTLYSDYDLGQGYYVNGMASGAYNRHTTLRHNVGFVPGLNANGDFNSHQFAARAETGRAFSVDSFIFTPMALVNWVYYSPDSYIETGAGSADLHVITRTLQQLDLGIGGKISRSLTNDTGARIVPELHAAYRREMIGDQLDTLSNFTGGGPAFAGESPVPAQDKFNIGAQVKYSTIDNLELTAAYDFDTKQDFTAHAGFLRAGYKF